MTTTATKPRRHYATYSPGVLDLARELLTQYGCAPSEKGGASWMRRYGPRVLDPFAGTGKIHTLREHGYRTEGVELEPEGVEHDERTTQGSALDLPWRANTFDAVVTSPCYGNRMADVDLRESAAGNYAKWLGRRASEGSACHLQWGDAYREFHRAAWAEAVRVLRPGGVFVLNISDHYRGYKLQHVPEWHYGALHGVGLRLRCIRELPTPRMTYGANAHRPECEYVTAFTND